MGPVSFARFFSVCSLVLLFRVGGEANRKPVAGISDHHRSAIVYSLDANASGVTETINNIVNLTVVSTDVNDLRAEYRAGFVQAKLQGDTIRSARDNAWDGAYLTDPYHTFPQQLPPTAGELGDTADLLNANYQAFLEYVRQPSTDQHVAYRLKRLLFRMLGIYHGVSRDDPAILDCSGDWLPDSAYFQASELTLGYETATVTFLDIYFLNAYCDLLDAVSFSAPGGMRTGDWPDRCSAFLKRAGGQVILAHNTWAPFLSQTMTETLVVNEDAMTFNPSNPGLLASTTDFGYNNKGIMYNETTHRADHSDVKLLGLWMFWRAALAEQFAGSIPAFFDALSLDNSGTYLSGYMLVDATSNETGLMEMSDRCFVYYRSAGGEYSVSSRSLDGELCSTEYDDEMVTTEYLMGFNYPASLQVRADLQSSDNRPARREQFKKLLPRITNVENSKFAITYIDPRNPLSIFGRWDLGYGETDSPKQIPDGAVDAKVGSTSMVLAFMNLSGVLDLSSSATGFWMLYGTGHVRGKPFIWSESLWNGQTLRDVPDVVDGRFTLLPVHLK